MFWLLLHLLTPSSFATECLGPQPARANLIYLHGMDTPKPGPLERSNRMILSRIASELQIRVALPRAKEICRDGKRLCWNPGNPTPENVELALEDASDQSRECFSGESVDGIVGFSDGGFLVNKILRYCLSTPYLSVISVGSAGITLPSDPQDLNGCHKLELLLGKQDPTLESGEEFAAKMKSLGGDVDLIEFDGRHEVPYEPLRGLLENSILRGDANP